MAHHRSRITKYLFALLVIVVLLYGYFEARHVLYGPQIMFAHDAEVIIVEDELVEISGTVKNVTELTFGGRSLLIDDNGNFSEDVLLAPGVNHFMFEARDRFGRIQREELQIVYQPPEHGQQ